MKHLVALLWSICPAAAVRVPGQSPVPNMPNTRDQLFLDMTVDNLVYMKLISNVTVYNDFRSVCRQIIADSCGGRIGPEHVEMQVIAMQGSFHVTATITTPRGVDAGHVVTALSAAPLSASLAAAVSQVPGMVDFAVDTVSVSGAALEILDKGGVSYGDLHVHNIHGDQMDIRRPGDHSFLVLPRGASRGQASLHVEAHVAPRGGLCDGLYYITGLKLAGRLMHTLGGDIELYTTTDKFNSPEAVGLKVGKSSNISLQQFRARIPKRNLTVFQYSPQLPTKLNTHVTTLTMQIRVGPVIMYVDWSHEKVKDGFANWIGLSVAGLDATKDVGGILGLDKDLDARWPLAACQELAQLAAGPQPALVAGGGPQAPARATGSEGQARKFRSWVTVDS